MRAAGIVGGLTLDAIRSIELPLTSAEIEAGFEDACSRAGDKWHGARLAEGRRGRLFLHVG